MIVPQVLMQKSHMNQFLDNLISKQKIKRGPAGEGVSINEGNL